MLSDMYGSSVSQKIRIIYGGSLNKDNSAEIFEITNVDGGLVGGASLTANSFLPIIHALNTIRTKC
jgi:triosephosphate isomerase